MNRLMQRLGYGKVCGHIYVPVEQTKFRIEGALKERSQQRKLSMLKALNAPPS